MIEISGAGVRGLSCGIKLLESGLDVTIFEARQEIGNPVRSPGYIVDLDLEFIEKTAAKKNDFGWGFRREWFEKLLAKKFVDLGGIIKLKTIGPEKSVNCTGGKTIAPGWPSSGSQFNLVKWNGGIVISSDIPSEFELNNIEDDRFCFERGDFRNTFCYQVLVNHIDHRQFESDHFRDLSTKRASCIDYVFT